MRDTMLNWSLSFLLVVVVVIAMAYFIEDREWFFLGCLGLTLALAVWDIWTRGQFFISGGKL